MVDFGKRLKGRHRRRGRGLRVMKKRRMLKMRLSPRLIKMIRRLMIVLAGSGVGLGLLGWWWVGHQGEWNGVNRINILVVGRENRQVELVSYEPTSKRLSLIWLGGDVEVPTAWGYGNYRLGVLRDLGVQEGLGLELLDRSVSGWLGIPVAGTVVVGELEQAKLAGWSSLRWQLLTTARGNLSWADRIKLFRETAEIFQSQIETEDLTVGSWYRTEFDPAGDRRLVPVKERLGKLVRTYLQDEQVTGVAGKEVAVVNATAHEGLAAEAAGWLQLMGYDVVNITNGVGVEESSRLLVATSTSGQGFYLVPMEMVFGIEPVVQTDIESKYRADVVLIVGEDYYRLWYGKNE